VAIGDLAFEQGLADAEEVVGLGEVRVAADSVGARQQLVGVELELSLLALGRSAG
jgi:hypothetical protein